MTTRVCRIHPTRLFALYYHQSPIYPSIRTRNMADTTQEPVAKRQRTEDGQHSSVAPSSTLLIKRLSEKAKLPTRGSALAAGYDLYRCAAFRMYETSLI
jgi:hypothetical protein